MGAFQSQTLIVQVIKKKYSRTVNKQLLRNYLHIEFMTSQILCTKEMVFQQNLSEKAYFIAKMSSPASSDFWKAPLANDFGRGRLSWTLADKGRGRSSRL